MSSIIMILLALTVAVTGVLLAITPWLMRRNECFAVTVPESAQDDPRLRAFKLDYAKKVLVITAVCTIVTAASSFTAGDDETGALVYSAVLTVSVFALIFVGFGLMLHYRKKVQAVKKAEGWAARAQQAVALVSEEEVPAAVPLIWNVLYIPIILATVAVGVVGYPAMPDKVPMHYDFAGNVTDWADKGFGVAAFPALLAVFMAVVFVFCHWSIIRSKRPTGLGSPATSAFAYGMFARANSAFLLVGGLVITAACGLGFMMSMVGYIPMSVALALIMLASFVLVAGSIVVSVVYGQAGSRLYKRMQEAGGKSADDVLLADDDEHWKLGIFYVNPDDASLFLPERFGIGWTLNLGRPAAWAILVGVVLATIVFVAVSIAMTS